MKVSDSLAESLVGLAQAANEAHNAGLAKLRGSLAAFARAGEALIEAKVQVGHGDWTAWVVANCSFSVWQARRYMQIGRELEANAPRGAVLSLRETLRRLAKPKDGAEAESTIAPADSPQRADSCRLYCASVSEPPPDILPESVDCIITDPPYPKEFLWAYGDLAKFAAHALKPGGSLLAMAGQSYLPVVYDHLAKHLTYHWTIAYLTPGGQAVQLWDRKVNTFWKPVLWFTNDSSQMSDRWTGDVCKSAVNDNDKRFHDWGQSESGMADLVERVTEPGQLICDPFLGGGTTAVVALALERAFVGFDKDEAAVRTTRKRLGLT